MSILKITTRTVQALSALLGVATIIGFLAKCAWMFDLFSHFRVQYLVLATLFTIIFIIIKKNHWVALSALIVMINFALIYPLYIPNTQPNDAQGPEITLLQVNTLATNTEYQKVQDLIQRTDPDIITVQEMNNAWQQGVGPVLEGYPYRDSQTYTFATGHVFGPAIFSRLPLKNIQKQHIGEIPAPIIIAQLESETPVTIMSVHPMAPEFPSWWRNRNSQLKQLEHIANNTQGEIIMAGDFNSTSWSWNFQQLLKNTNLRDSRKGFGIQSTWLAGPLSPFRIPIDHILVTENIEVQERYIEKQVGSDHRPVVIKLQLPE